MAASVLACVVACVRLAVTLMVTLFKVNDKVPPVLVVATPLAPLAEVAAAVAVKPCMPELLIAAAIALPSVATVPRATTVPGPARVAVKADAAPLVMAPKDCWLKPLNWPSALVRALLIELMVILSAAVALAPTWKSFAVNEPSSSLVPLNDEFCATRSISAISDCTSPSMAA